MSELQGLIERLTVATGPDRWLDAEIHRAVTPELADTIADFTMGWCVGGNHVTPVKAPAYTASLDAALSLVPEGKWWLLGKGKTREDEPLYGAQIFEGDMLERDTVIADGEHDATPAIALCIAALKARSPGLPHGAETER